MLSDGRTFQAALLDLGQATPLLPKTSDHSASSSYATSSILGTEEPSQRVSDVPGVPAGDVKGVVMSMTEGRLSEVDGLPRKGVVVGEEDYAGCQGGYEEKPEEEGREGLGVPAMSRKDVQTIRDILLGNVKAPNHISAGVGNGGFLSLAPEWQR